MIHRHTALRLPAVAAWVLGASLAVGCTRPEPGPELAALETITAADLARHIEVLASDEFEGRLPGTPGETRTTEYLVERFAEMGLEPANDDSWFQEVPLVSITADPSAQLAVKSRSGTHALSYARDYMAWTKRVVPQVELRDSELIFVGYGVVAPEYGWNDYEEVDVTGKTVVMLVNDPGFASGDSELFNGRAMTYYGRWTYKYEEAARQGAAAALIVHETVPAGYDWAVVSGSWSGPQFDLIAEDDNLSRVAVEGWLTLESARALLRSAGHDFDRLKASALSEDFRAVATGLTASISLRNTIERSRSNNVVAVLPGGHRAEEIVLYLAHWDHLGRDPGLEGDQVYNGARDNASGTAALLEVAEAFASLQQRPDRSIVFLATTAEEQGLLGSAYYAEHPLFPLNKTAAAVNMDVINTFGRTTDLVVVGYGNSELDGYLAAAAATQNRILVPDPDAEKGFFYRSDHFPLSKAGVPAIYADPGTTHVEHGKDWITARKNEYRSLRYHKPADEYSPEWDLSGGVEDTQVFFLTGYALANSDAFPNWTEGSEFRARRDAMMGGRP